MIVAFLIDNLINILILGIKYYFWYFARKFSIYVNIFCKNSLFISISIYFKINLIRYFKFLERYQYHPSTKIVSHIWTWNLEAKHWIIKRRIAIFTQNWRFEAHWKFLEFSDIINRISKLDVSRFWNSSWKISET